MILAVFETKRHAKLVTVMLKLCHVCKLDV